MVEVLGYVRVSTDEQVSSGAGLLAQRSHISAEAERRGWHLLDIIEDAGWSARDLRRPGIQHALDLLRHRRADVLMVAKLDRMSRSLLDFAAVMERSRKEGWALVALDLGVDTTSPAGEAMASVMATFAQLERRLIAQRTREALAVKRSQGVVLGRPRTLPSSTVLRILTERAAGATLTAIAEGLDRDGVPTGRGGRRWYPATVRGVLLSRSRIPGKEAEDAA